jgi:hypothetical protein
MNNLQKFKNGLLIGDTVVCLVDDINDQLTFGFTDSIKKIKYNLTLLEKVFEKIEYEESLKRSKQGLTTLFPFGRYIVILMISKNKLHMKMFFFDFRIDYKLINESFNLFSENIKLQFKKIKYYMEEFFNESFDKVVLSTSLEPIE